MYNYRSLKKGDVIEHEMFGKGVVVDGRVAKGSTRVEFENYGTKLITRSNEYSAYKKFEEENE